MGGKACFCGSGLGLERPDVQKGAPVHSGRYAVIGLSTYNGLRRSENRIVYIGLYRILGGVERGGIPQGGVV